MTPPLAPETTSLPRADAPLGAPLPPPGADPAAPRGKDLSWPFLALCAYLFVGTAAIDEEWPSVGALRPRLVLGALLLVALAARAAARWKKAGPREVEAARARRSAGLAAGTAPGTRSLVAFLAAGLVSAAWAFEPSRAWPAVIENTTRALAFFLVVALVRTRRQVAVLALVLAAAHGLYLCRSALEYAAGRYDFKMGVKRMLGAGTAYADPNSFAASVVLALPFVAWVAMRSRSPWPKAAAVAYALLGAVCVVLAHSRSGLVLLALAAAWVVLSLPRAGAKAGALAVFGVLGVLLAGTLTDAAAKRFAGILSPDTYERDPSTHGRIEGYEVSWRIFSEHPLVGVGPDNWGLYRARKVDGNPHDPHNLAGQLVATRGLAGAVPFVAFVAAGVAFAWRRRRAGKASSDPWERSVAGLASVALATVGLLLVSGLAAHNLDRPAWYLVPALLFAAARAGSTRAAGEAP